MVTDVLYGFLTGGGENGWTVLEGGAGGADACAARFAEEFVEPQEHEQYLADWDAHGLSAGPLRNQRMIENGKPDVVLAFIDKPLEESKGTHDCVKRAKKAGIPTYVIRKEA